MERTGLTLVWDGRVASEDGWSGKLSGAFLSRRSQAATHVLVTRRWLRSVRVVSLDGAYQREGDRLVVARGADHTRRAGRGSTRLTDKTRVSLAGKPVPLKGLVIDGKTGTPRYVLVSYNKETRALRSGQVHSLTAGTPSVRLREEDAAALPVYRPSSEAQRRASTALAEIDDSAGRVFGDVTVSLEEGVAHLRGFVQLPIEREEAERAVRSAKGVLEVQNSIITDWDLRIAVASALANECITHQGLVTVKSRHGKVSLLGHLPSRKLVERSIDIATHTEGVRSVSSHLEVA